MVFEARLRLQGQGRLPYALAIEGLYELESEIEYRGLYLGRDYRANYTGQGDYLPEIKLSSWLVFYGPKG